MIRLSEEIKELLIKIIIPAFVMVVVKISVQNNRERMSLTNIIASVVSGLGLAYLSSGLILKHFSDEMVTLIAAGVALTAEHIVSIVLYRLNWDKIGDAFLSAVQSWINRKMGNK